MPLHKEPIERRAGAASSRIRAPDCKPPVSIESAGKYAMRLRIRFHNTAAAGPDLTGLLARPDSAFAGENRLLKHDRATSLCVVETAGGAILVKRYNTCLLYTSDAADE